MLWIFEIVELVSPARASVAGIAEDTTPAGTADATTATASVACSGASAARSTSEVAGKHVLTHQCSLAATHPVFPVQA
jgi:hypothetical protein